MAFTTLIFANIILSLVNRSFYYSVFTSLRNKNNMMVLINVITLLLLALILNVTPVSNFFMVVPLNAYEIGICLLIALISVLWIEIWKWILRQNKPAF
jgi:Ca2+-transporting ATPase